MKRTMAAATALLLASCSPVQDMATANAAIVTFHRELDAAQFDTVYANAAPELKRVTSQAALTQLLAAINRKLGPFQSGASTGWNDNLATSGHFVTVGYSAKYARGPAVETFVFRLDGSQPLLVSYHINSTALIAN